MTSPANHVAKRFAKVFAEAGGLLSHPLRVGPLLGKLASDGMRVSFEQRHLYSYAKTTRDSQETLNLLVRWILDAQCPDGGIAAYYSLLSGYSKAYPEVTGYIIPTLYDFAHASGDRVAIAAAQRATAWLLSLQMPSGTFPGGLQGSEGKPSVFNTGQILQGLVCAYSETKQSEILQSAILAGEWLIQQQRADGCWSGAGAYQNEVHTYYSMVAWALAQLSRCSGDDRYATAAERNITWVLSRFRPSGWIDGINLREHPNYLHFMAYILQGVLECAILRHRRDAMDAVAKSAWILLRKFETNKSLCGAYDEDFKHGRRFACLTGNAQMSCVWMRLFELSNDLRYLNAALKMNEMLKQLIPAKGSRGIVGGVSGSYPIWERYQPLRHISWGCKFVADALLTEDRLMRSLEAREVEAVPCAS